MRTRYYFAILICFIAVFAVITYGYLYSYLFIRERQTQLRETEPLQSIPNGTKILLFYTTWFGNLPWPSLGDNKKGVTDENGKLCEVSACRISIHKGDFDRSDAVVYHGCSIKGIKDTVTRELYNVKPARQKWVWYEHEPPPKIMKHSYDPSILNNMMDITITYKNTSDIVVPYGHYTALLPSEKRPENSHNYATGRDKLVLWTVSNCKPKLRIKIAWKLMQYIPVDVYGDCWDSFYWSKRNCTKGMHTCNALKRRYKFRLVLENYNCQDYVTEKYWNKALDANIVPILVAGSYNKRLLIPGSYINILDFQSARALADYLKYLDNNHTAYNEFFTWRQNYKSHPWTQGWICELCKLLHNNSSRDKPPVKDFGKFWGVEENCYAYDNYIYYRWLLAGASSTGYSKFLTMLALTTSVSMV